MTFTPGKLAFFLTELPLSAREDCEDAYLQFEFLHKNNDEETTLISTSKKFCTGYHFLGDEGKLFVLDTAANAGQPLINLFKAKMVKTKKKARFNIKVWNGQDMEFDG